jgi:4-amino-4-deoxychorismate lyase
MPSQIRRVVQFQSQRLPTPPSGGAVLRVCDLRLGLQPRLAGIKHLNRLENVLARAEWSDPAIHEGLLLDQDGWVISGCMSNLFVVRAGELHTPCLARCGVAGVTRARLMRLAAEAGMRVQEVDLDLAALLAADELFLTNSLIGLWPVARLQARTWREHPVSARCAGWLDV